MSITAARLLNETPTSENQYNIQDPSKPDRLAESARYQVETDDPNESILNIENASGVPARGALHPTKPGLAVSGKSVARDSGSRLIWYVTVRYEPYGMTNETLNPPELNLPWNQAPQVTIYSQSIGQKPLVKTYTTGDAQFAPSKAVVNAAGMEFDPPVMDDVDVTVIEITRNELDFNPTHVITFRRTTNALPEQLLGFTIAIKHGKIDRIGFTPQIYIDPVTQDQTRYFSVSYTILIADGIGWEIDVANRGMKVLNQAGTDLIEIPKITEPTWLSANGKSTTKTANYLRFCPLFPADWTPLGLPRESV